MMKLGRWTLLLCLVVTMPLTAQTSPPFTVAEVAAFDEPWALALLPDGRLLVTEKKGNLILVSQDGQKSRPISGLPDVDYGGQGGLGDVTLHPDYANNSFIYLSFAESGVGNTRGAAVVRARLNDGGRSVSLSDVETIWRQYPKLLGRGHYGHRMIFDAAGFLWIASGDRQKFTPAQDMQSNVGKIIRLHADGSVPDDNPFVDYDSKDALVDDGGVYKEVWSLGHRNTLGLAFDLDGQLWNMEMGPAGGDELNRIVKAGNYGYPNVSNGEHYDGRPMPDHAPGDGYLAPAIWWTPTVSPGELIVYRGNAFADWQGDALIAGLSSRAIVRVALDGDAATEVARYDMGARIRGLAEASDGSLWVLEDENRGSAGRLLRLTPKP